MGVSTASTQIEGGQVGSNWNDWYRQGRITDGADPATGGVNEELFNHYVANQEYDVQ